jgi:tetratricopeptide (TPR) repeat protein
LELLSPYRGLGRAYIRAGRYPDAITTLQTARDVSQRNLGLFNVEQSPLLDDITTAYLGLGDTREAQRFQIERLDYAIKRFGATDQRVIPFRYHLADYYERSRLPTSARDQYTEVLKTQESQLGLAPPLAAFASSCTSTCSPIRHSTAKRARASFRCSSRTRTRIRSSAAWRSQPSATGRSSAKRTRRAATTNRPGRR